jgi:Xaa-Pro aminopeptidase
MNDLFAACTRRQDRVRQALESVGADALLVGHSTDIRYLTGFGGHDSLLLVSRQGTPPVIITDLRHDQLLEPWREAAAATVVMGTRHQLGRSAAEACESGGIATVAIQAEHVTLAARKALARALPKIGFVETDGLVGTLRMCKDAMEIAAIERAIGIHQDAMQAALAQLSPGMTELEFAASVEYEMKTRGASRPSFETCVSAEANSAVIHYATGHDTIREGTLLLDWGAVAGDYCSDVTRTYGIGGFPAPVSEIYDIVLEAQSAAIDACAPGRSCAEIDGIARKIITDAGYGEQFGHGLGHGIGLDVHEAPYFNQQSTEVRLEPGMVMTVEPGIYIPGTGGVRIEDDVLITEDGCRVLTNFPKDHSDMVLEPMGVGHA